MNIKRICLFLLILCVLAPIGACGRQNEDDKITVQATVNGESITTDELDYFKGKLKAEVLNDYLQKYTLEYAPDIWSREFGGKSPEKDLYEQALEKCVMAKLQFVLMREKGIYTDISYQGLYNKAVAFNEENSSKQGVVGIKTIKIEQFYSYYLDNGVMELRNILAKQEIKPSPAEISERASELKASGKYSDNTGFDSIAESALITEKYDDYVTALRNSAEIVITQN